MEIYNDIYNYIVKECNSRGYGKPRAIYCHMYNETGKFKSSLWTKYFNPAGLKCGSSWKGKSVNLTTKEEYKVGTLTTIKDNFRVFDNAEAGVKGYFDFLAYNRYSKAREAKTDEEFVYALKEGGWWTSSTQSSTIIRLMGEFDNANGNRFTKENIKQLQIAINNLMNSGLVIDGIIGPKTKKALTDLYIKVTEG